MEDLFVFIISVFIFLFLLVAALFANSLTIASNLIFFGIVVLLVPISLVRVLKYRKFKAYEKVFPIFLRDVAESLQSGSTISNSIQQCEKVDYGSFTIEVKKMSNQLSWNIPVDKVLESFSSRVKHSKILSRSITIIRQAEKSGGNVSESMESLAENIQSLRDVQEEKSILLNQQMLIMYAIFFIFLGISVAILRFLIPLFETPSNVGGFVLQGFNENPCQACISSSDFGCFGCTSMFAVSTVFDFGAKEQTATYYRALFFSMIVIQGFFSGLIAGQISSDSLSAGIKHSFAMLLIGIFIFVLIIRLGLA